MKLTSNAQIAAIPTPEKEQEISDRKIPKLKLRVTKNGSKTFYLIWRDKHHKRRKYRIGTFEEEIGLPGARQVAEKLLAKIALGEDPQATRIDERAGIKRSKALKLRAFFYDNYLPWAEQKSPWPEKNKRSAKNTRYLIEHNFEHLLDKSMDAITPWDLKKFTQARTKAGIKPATINRAVSALIAVLNRAVKAEVIDVNPLRNHEHLSVGERGVVRYLTDKELKRLNRALDKRDGYFPIMVKLLLHTGARPKEAMTLRWENVDLEAKRITLVAAYTKTGKTRHIPLNSTIHTALTEWEKECPSDEWVFPATFTRTRPEVSHIASFQKAWDSLMRETKIKNFRRYDCRHEFASKLAMSGVSIYEIAELLGHSSIEMSRVYAHLSPEHLQNAVERIA